MYMRNWIIAHMMGAVAMVSMGGCEEEPIPAYANVNTFGYAGVQVGTSINVYPGQQIQGTGIPAGAIVDSIIDIDTVYSTGQPTQFRTTFSYSVPVSAISDGWLYIDEQVVGAFELPFEVPAMADGEHTVRIRPGIKLNGLESQRTPHPFLNDYLTTSKLAPDSITYFHALTSYRDGVTLAVNEDFNGVGSSIKSTTYSLHDFQRVNDTVLYPTNEVMRMYINTGEVGYGECESQNVYDLPKSGRTVLLEFDYRCNAALSAGIFVYQSGGGVDDIPIVTLYPTSEWKHVVVNLTENVSYYSNSIGQSLLFRISANGDQTEVQEALIDNIILAF
jgi:hypothetical protein